MDENVFTSILLCPNLKFEALLLKDIYRILCFIHMKELKMYFVSPIVIVDRYVVCITLHLCLSKLCLCACVV